MRSFDQDHFRLADPKVLDFGKGFVLSDHFESIIFENLSFTNCR